MTAPGEELSPVAESGGTSANWDLLFCRFKDSSLLSLILIDLLGVGLLSAPRDSLSEDLFLVPRDSLSVLVLARSRSPSDSEADEATDECEGDFLNRRVEVLSRRDLSWSLERCDAAVLLDREWSLSVLRNATYRVALRKGTMGE